MICDLAKRHMTIRDDSLVLCGFGLTAVLAPATFCLTFDEPRDATMLLALGSVCLWLALLIARLAMRLTLSLTIEDKALTRKTLRGKQIIAWSDVLSVRSRHAPASSPGQVLRVECRDGHFTVSLPRKVSALTETLELISECGPHIKWVVGERIASPEDHEDAFHRWLRVSLTSAAICYPSPVALKLLGVLSAPWGAILICPLTPAVISLYVAAILVLMARRLKYDAENPPLDLDRRCRLKQGSLSSAVRRHYWAYHPRGPLPVLSLSLLAIGGYYAFCYWLSRLLPAEPASSRLILIPPIAVTIFNALFWLGQYVYHYGYVKAYRQSHQPMKMTDRSLPEPSACLDAHAERTLVRNAESDSSSQAPRSGA
ncbi:MAG: hypothetical protein JXQ73_31730 [Phycisphaerae bacterium]|nr:hypothetical protein [Phycisphaerae bacterium]